MKTVLLALFLAAFLAAACSSKAGTGALVGGGVGTGVGVLISPTPTGALVGAGVGAASGALIGAALDSEDHSNLAQRSPQTTDRIDKNKQLSVEDIKNMSNAGISDDKIIGTIHSTGSVFHLSSSEIDDLKDSGVSQRVIDYMLRTAYE
jgi:hypothetical protein